MAEKKSNNRTTVSHDGHRQRMKARFLENGLDGFSGHEVLEMLLFYALPYRDTNELGHVLESHFGSLNRVLDADYEDLIKVPGVTPHVATLITLCGKVCHRYYRNLSEMGTILNNTKQIGDYLLPWFFGQKNETVVLLSMDNRRRVLNCTRIFEGSVESTNFYMRTALKQALQDNATRVVIAHNHPNGFAFPSKSDMATTSRFLDVLKTAEIQLVDHLIFSEDDYVSLADSVEASSIFTHQPAAVSYRH